MKENTINDLLKVFGKYSFMLNNQNKESMFRKKTQKLIEISHFFKSVRWKYSKVQTKIS